MNRKKIYTLYLMVFGAVCGAMNYNLWKLGKMVKELKDNIATTDDINMLCEEIDTNLKDIILKVERMDQKVEDLNQNLKELTLIIREHMRLEDERYAPVLEKENLMIGSPVEFKTNDILLYQDIYSLATHQNGLLSYFRNDEIHYIQSFIMNDGDTIYNVSDNETYELYLASSYEVIGATLVNQYSFQNPEFIEIEGRASIEDLCLRKTK